MKELLKRITIVPVKSITRTTFYFLIGYIVGKVMARALGETIILEASDVASKIALLICIIHMYTDIDRNKNTNIERGKHEK